MKLKNILFISLLVICTASTSFAGRTSISNVSANPYRSAISLDAGTGKVLFEKNADAPAYPASSLKLMVLLVILDRIEQGTLRLDETVQVTKEASKMGGSQVYLDPKEQFPVEELLYALIIQSANDAAVALATHVAGSKEGFVKLMNQKAKELGMNNTRFYSVHGLPPANGQKVDISTARDFGILCRHLSTKPEVFQYTSAQVRDFRGGEFVMRTHNHLLQKLDGCDGFKTGYFSKAGFSIAATAKRDGVRIIAIVMGSENRDVRDATTIELITKGFSMVSPQPESVVQADKPQPSSAVQQVKKTKLETGVQNAVPEASQDEEQNEEQDEELGEEQDEESGSGWGMFFLGLVLGALLYAGTETFISKKQKVKSWKYK